MSFTIKVVFKNLQGNVDHSVIKDVRAWGCDPSGSLKIFTKSTGVNADLMYAANVWQVVSIVEQTIVKRMICDHCWDIQTEVNRETKCRIAGPDGHLWAEEKKA